MTFGLRCSGPACRPHPASLPVRVPTVEDLLHASFGFTSRLRLAFRYGCRHRPRLAPFIQLDSAHAGHTPAASLLAGAICRDFPTNDENSVPVFCCDSAERKLGGGAEAPPHTAEHKLSDIG